MNTTKRESMPTSAPAPAGRLVAETVAISLNGIALPAKLLVPIGARGIVLFTIANGCLRETARTGLVAQSIEDAGIGTLSLSLLTPSEAEKDKSNSYWSYDLELLTHRLLQATCWIMHEPATRELGIGYCATSTIAAAALVAAGQLGYAVEAVVTRGGRPDLAGESLPKVTAPTRLIIGERDGALVNINRRAFEHLTCRKDLAVVREAGHLFDEAGALEDVGRLSADWFAKYLKPLRRTLKS